MQCIRCANEIITNVVQSNGERYVTTLTGALRRVVLRFTFRQRALNPSVSSTRYLDAIGGDVTGVFLIDSLTTK